MWEAGAVVELGREAKAAMGMVRTLTAHLLCLVATLRSLRGLSNAQPHDQPYKLIQPALSLDLLRGSDGGLGRLASLSRWVGTLSAVAGFGSWEPEAAASWACWSRSGPTE